jgi:hypothetical protein
VRERESKKGESVREKWEKEGEKNKGKNTRVSKGKGK